MNKEPTVEELKKYILKSLTYSEVDEQNDTTRNIVSGLLNKLESLCKKEEKKKFLVAYRAYLPEDIFSKRMKELLEEKDSKRHVLESLDYVKHGRVRRIV